MLHAAIDRYGGMIHARCQRQLPPHLVEEAVQAVFLVYARRDTEADAGPDLAHYLMRVCSNVIRNLRRDERRHRQRYLALPAQQEELAVAETEHDARELSLHLDDALEQLPARERNAITLHFLAGHSCAEIARQQGCPASTVVSRVQRGLERLRGILGKGGVTCSATLLLMYCQALAAETLPPDICQRLHRQASSPDTAAMAGADRLGWTRSRPRGAGIMLLSLIGAGLIGALSVAIATPMSAQSRHPVPMAATATPTPPEPEQNHDGGQLWQFTIPDIAATARQLADLPEFQFLPEPAQRMLIDQAQQLGAGTILIEFTEKSLALSVELRDPTAADTIQQLLTRGLQYMGWQHDQEPARWQHDNGTLHLEIGPAITTTILPQIPQAVDIHIMAYDPTASANPMRSTEVRIDFDPNGSTIDLLGPVDRSGTDALPTHPLPNALAAARWQSGPWMQPTVSMIANMAAIRLSQSSQRGQLNVQLKTEANTIAIDTTLADADGIPIQELPDTRIDDAIKALLSGAGDPAWAAVLPNAGLPSLILDVPVAAEQAQMITTVLREELHASEQADGLQITWDEWLPIQVSSTDGRMRLQCLNTQALPEPEVDPQAEALPVWANQFQMQVNTGDFMQQVAPLLGLNAVQAAAFAEQPPTRLLRGLNADGRMISRLEGNLLVAAYAASAPLQALVYLNDVMKNDG